MFKFKSDFPMHPFLLAAALALLPVRMPAEEKEPPPSPSQEAEESPELKEGKERLEECRKLFREGKQNEAMKLAIESIDVFVAPYPKLKWIDVGTIEAGKYRVVIHVNTTEDERAKVKNYIVRPYTFCVFPKDPEGKMLYVIDFEHGYDEGVLKTAALGRYSGGMHINYGILDPKSDFTAVRDAALKLIRGGKIESSEE